MRKARLINFFIMILFSLFIFFACGNNEENKEEHGVNSDDDSKKRSYNVVDTNQNICYDQSSEISCPSAGQSFYGQDGMIDGKQPSFQDNGDGTVTDLITGLMWQKDPGEKKSYTEAVSDADSFTLAEYDDWRLPTIKELYSLIFFSGIDPSEANAEDFDALVPFIDAAFFAFEYGDEASGDRLIDSQWATSTIYESTVMDGQECFFGVNFADGRIKCYPTSNKEYFVIYVRNTGSYGQNNFSENGDGTISDNATGLMWPKSDYGKQVTWEEALQVCDDFNLGEHYDWRLPNAKELQSIVDYSRSPDTTDSAAIDPIFNSTSIINEAGQSDYPFYWSSTTHVNLQGGTFAAYVAFGRALGYMNGEWMDVHGAGAQRSAPKTGDPSNWPEGNGPQGDAIRINNFVRCVRDDEGTVESQDDDDVASDDDANDDDDDDTPSPPPEEAVEACEGKDLGDECSFEAPHGTVSGTCTLIGDILACKP